MRLKKQNLGLVLLFTTIICGSFVLSSSSQAAKKKKKSTKSTVTSNCIACLNSFDPETLKFGIDEEKCTKRVAKCFKNDYTDQCEGIISECIQANCSASGSCADVSGNKNLFFGCLKSANQVLPYQCASYIKGYAESKASEVNNQIAAQKRASDEKIAATNKAAADADAASKERIAEMQEETKRKQIEEENKLKLKLEQEKAQREKEENAAAKKAEQDAKNNKPNVKYANLKNEAKQGLTSAKNYITKAFNLLGITKADNTQQNKYAPAPVSVSQITGDGSSKANSIIKGSRYSTTSSFICTKDVKENVIKNEIQNAYNAVKKSYDKLATGISEIEVANSDDSVSGKISDEKVEELYTLQNNLSDIMNDMSNRMSNLKTSCETRCAGIAPFSISTTAISAKVEFDANGNIIQDKPTNDSNSYSCKELENSSTGLNAIIGMEGGSSVVDANKVKELTYNITETVVSLDRDLDKNIIDIQLGNISNVTKVDYPAVDSCIQYMVLDTTNYVNCLANVLGQQITSLANNKTNERTKKELNSSINSVIKTLNSPNYNSSTEKLYCGKINDSNIWNDGSESDNNTVTRYAAVTINFDTNSATDNYNRFYNCILSITNALNKVKDNGTKTGNFNFQIIDADKNNNIIYLSTGDSVSPKTLAENKLGWNDTKTCDIVVVNSNNNNNIQFFTGNGVMSMPNQTTTNIDMNRSVLQCTCTDESENSLSFQKINMGGYGKNCSQKQSN